MTRHILIVDGVPTNRILLRARMLAACDGVTLVDRAADTVVAARRIAPDLVLLGQSVPMAEAAAACVALRADPGCARMAIIALLQDPADRLALVQAGADMTLPRPVDDVALLTHVRDLLRMRDPRPQPDPQPEAFATLGLAEPPAIFAARARIGLIAAQPDTAQRWRATLARALNAEFSLLPGRAALAAAGPACDLYLVDSDLAPGHGGIQLARELRQHPDRRDAAICLVMAGPSESERAIALDLGVDEVLAADFSATEAAARARQMIARKQEQDRLRHRLAEGLRLAATDPLTGLHNRRYALPALQRMLEVATHAGRGGAVMVLDLDHFKTVNDHHGHAAGDAVLIEAAARLQLALRPGDLLARLGGEEFLIALSDVGPDQARGIADQLRRCLSTRPIRVPGCPGGLQITASIGLALTGARVESADQLIARADRAMLCAKAEGRDQVALVSQGTA